MTISEKVPTYVINLTAETERKLSIKEELRGIGIEPNFITAFDGHDPKFPFYRYKHLSGSFWRRKNDFKPGAFACYLSHAKCWKEVSKSDSPYCMILEDDVSIDAKAFFELDIATSVKTFDIIFISESSLRLIAPIQASDMYLSSSDALKQLVYKYESSIKISSPGGYGYILSKRGATKLLKMMKTRKISMGVDYAMLFNSINLIDIENFFSRPESSLPEPLKFYIETEKKHILSGKSPINLESFIYTPTSIVKIKDFPSNINHNFFLENNVFNIVR